MEDFCSVTKRKCKNNKSIGNEDCCASQPNPLMSLPIMVKLFVAATNIVSATIKIFYVSWDSDNQDHRHK